MDPITASRCVVAYIMFSLLPSGYCLSQPTREEVASRIDEYLNTQVAAGQFSGSVLVADDGEVVISKGYGMANIELNVPNTSATKFRLGSVTKQFTAMAIMILQERGLVSVQDLISMYAPDGPPAWGSITIHHLLTHTSGIPDFTGVPGFWPDYVRSPRTLDETIALFRDLPLRFAPGAKFEYSNSGYVLLGKIIEVVTGDSYEHFIGQNIFEPLGMSNSGYDDSRPIIIDRADGYVKENKVLLNAIHIEYVADAAGALYSTVGDLLLWDQALYTTQLVSQASLDAIFTGYVASDIANNDYGYGWRLGKSFNRTVIWHHGVTSGFVAYIARFPQEGVCVIVLGNFQFVPIVNLGHELARIVQESFEPMPIAHWTLDETEGTSAYDYGGHHGTLNGGATWQATGGKVGGAVQLDGIDDYVSTPFILNPYSVPFSAFAWVKGEAPGRVILSQKNGANWLLTDSGGRLVTELKAPASQSGRTLASQAVITDGNWHRIGLVRDGTARILYVDDIEVARDTQTSLVAGINGLYIGTGKGLESNSFWSGLIDDVRIYDRAVRP